MFLNTSLVAVCNCRQISCHGTDTAVRTLAPVSVTPKSSRQRSLDRFIYKNHNRDKA